MTELNDVRARVYENYQTTTATNIYKGMNVSLERSIRQYHQRWHMFLPLQKNVRILDLGCGGGEFLLFLQQAGYSNIEGIDLSPEQIELARRRGLSQLQVADALSYLTNRPQNYGLINIQNVLEHLTRPELFQLLDSMVAALEPQGLIFGVVPNAKSLFGMQVRYGDITHEHCFTPKSLYQIFTVVGLKPIAILEHGPLAHGLVSTIRWTIWQAIRLAILTALMAESMDYGDRVYTQDMMFIAQKVK